MSARPPRPTSGARARAALLSAALQEHYPEAHCELNFDNPFQLLIATILSAQATDAGVNKATPALFRAHPDAAAFARAAPAEIEPFIRSIGLYRNKAKFIHAAAAMIVREFSGEVPRTMDDLLRLPGVARKTASVVLGNAFGIAEGFVVDTHVERLAKRFALARPGDTVARVERRLMALFPREDWVSLSHRLIWHGRRACTARGGACSEHPICTRFGVRCDRRAPAPVEVRVRGAGAGAGRARRRQGPRGAGPP